jgi:integrase
MCRAVSAGQGVSVIRVKLREKPGRYIQLYYVDPLTRKEVSRSAKTVTRAEANRAAAIWEQELAAKGPQTGPLHWDSFRIRFESEHLRQLEPRSRHSYNNALNRFEQLIGRPVDIKQISSSTLSEFLSKLTAVSGSRVTVANILRHVKSALSWGHKIGILPAVPRFVMPRAPKDKLMRGRPISDKEFEKFLAACEKVVAENPENWRFLLRGLWCSGLRISEAVKLSWDSPPIQIDLDSAKFPRVIFYEQKSGRQEVWPMPPEFAELLASVPVKQRTGRVFALGCEPGRIVSKIGEASKIRVNGSGKFVSAHDLRRTFGTRWSFKVRPIILQRLMRHANITTTLKYYVDQDADDISAELYKSVPATVPKKTTPARLDQKHTTKKAVKSTSRRVVR